MSIVVVLSMSWSNCFPMLMLFVGCGVSVTGRYVYVVIVSHCSFMCVPLADYAEPRSTRKVCRRRARPAVSRATNRAAISNRAARPAKCSSPCQRMTFKSRNEE